MASTETKTVTAQANRVFAPVHESRCRYVVMRGSAGSGKSADTAQNYILRLMSQPGRNLLCVRKTEESNRASTYAELQAAVGRLGLEAYWDSTVSPLQMRCKTSGAAILFREILDDRLRGKLPEGLFYQIKLTFNPVSANHWLKARFFDRRDDSVLAHRSTYLDNRFMDAAFHDRMERRRTLDPEGYRVYGLGKWGVAGGQYFSEWRESLHVCESFPLPASYRRYITLDYGLDMLAAYWIAVAPDGRAYVYRELYRSGLIISRAAQEIRARMQEPVFQTFAPPDLWNRRQDTGKSAADLFAEHGVTLTRAENDRVSGWYNVKEWLSPRKCADGVERPGVQIFRCCENLIRTLPSLRRDSINPNDVSDTPHELTHGPDALRYFLAGRPLPAKAQESTESGSFRRKTAAIPLKTRY